MAAPVRLPVGDIVLTRVEYFDIALGPEVANLTAEQVLADEAAVPTWATAEGQVNVGQALWVLEVNRLGPFLVEGDAEGRSLFALANREINLRIAEVYKTLPPPALARFGEVLSRTDEVV